MPSVLVPPLVLIVGLVAAACIVARRVGVIVPSVFIATYVLGVGALIFMNMAAFDMMDPKFRATWMRSWLEFYWPLWTIFFAPSAVTALLAGWFSRPIGWRDAAWLLGLYLLLILTAIEAGWALDSYLGRYGVWFLVGAFALLSTVFVVIAHVKRSQHAAAWNKSMTLPV